MKHFSIAFIGIVFLLIALNINAQTPSFEWAKSAGGTTNDLGRDIVTDALGNVYTTGDFRGTVDFDPGAGVFNLTSQGLSDIFVSKLDANGNFVWAKAMGGPSGDNGNSVAVDASGNVYTTGTFRFTSDFDPGPSVFNLIDPAGAGGADIFVSKLDASGNFIWAKQMGGPEFDNSSSIAVDNSGNVFTTGYFQLTADFDPGPATFNLTSTVTDIFVSKLDALGNFVWAKAMGGTGVSEGRSITTDLSGNLYTTGQFDGVTDFDPSAGVFNLTAASEDIFVSKLNASGNFVWAKQLGGASSDIGFSIAVDASGNVHTTGSFASTADFDPGAGIFNLTSLGALDIYVSKLDTNGNFIWARQMGGTGFDECLAIALDASGNVFTTGAFQGTVDFDPGSGTFNLTDLGILDIYVSKLDASGNFAWAVQIGGTSSESGTSIAVDNSFNLFITGDFSGTVDFDPSSVTENLTSIGGTDVFIQSLSQPLSITSFTPSSGPVGTTVIIDGTNFDATPANNTVQFNGTTAVVTASTATSITTTVPTGATTGKISVALAGNTATSTTDFTVTPAQNFITQWNLATAGSGTNQLSIGTATSGTVSYTWQQLPTGTSGSGTWSGSTLTITGLPTGATIRLEIAPTNFQRININNGGDRNRLTLVEQWGSTAWSSMSQAFYGCTNLQVTATDMPNLLGVTNMSYMFFGCTNLNSPNNIGSWNTAAVTNMSEMFVGASAFNQNMGAWNTGAVTNMNQMFRNASAFNQDIGAWTLNTVVNLGSMLDNTGMDCNNYSATLLGWSANPLTPNGRTLGAIGRQYGTNAVAARTDLVSAKSWTITGDTPSGTVCSSVSIPTIANFSPDNGPIGTTVTISGTNFSATLANNIVYFGATRATVTAATSTQLTVTVPTGATYQPISVLVNGLTAFSSKPFITTFADGGVIDACAFAAKVDITTGSAPYSVAIGDLDADGKPDLAVANETGNTISVFKNVSTLGSLTPTSFAAKVDFVTGASPYFVTIQDLDGDGKPELIATINGTDKVSIFKNNTTVGVINSSSFAAKVDFSTGQNPWIATIADFDQDGKPDLAIVNDVDNTVSILKNKSTTGVINTSSFASKVDFPTGNFPIGIASGDLDGDGKVDLAVTNQTDNTVSVLRNTSTAGNIDATSFDPKIDFPTGLDPYSVAIGDLDGDNNPEIAVANYSSGSVSVFGNAGTVGTISFLPKEDFSSGVGSGTVSISDIDGNGKPDLNITSGTEGVSILKNIGTSTPISASSFSPKVNFAVPNPYGLAIADLDGNGKPDVVSTNASGATASILRNTVSSLPSFTGGSFTPTSGPVGTVVTITGANFSTTPLNNTVKFNGVVATVTASTSTTINAIVPVGATTGSISIEIGCVTAFTFFPFTVTSGSTLTITTQPIDATICAGATTSFTTAATGTTNITYQWQRYILAGSLLQNITNGGAYSGTTTATLTINSSAGSLTGDFYTCVISGDLAASVSTNYVTLTVGPSLSAPLTTGASSCIPAAITLSASGGTNGQYRWYTLSSGGTNIIGEVNSTYATPLLSATTTYYVAINDGTCESTRTSVAATINTTPIAPTTTGASSCATSTMTLTAAGASNGLYRWYASATGATAIAGETSSSYITPSISATSTYFVSINDGTCESMRAPVVATINTPPLAPTVTGATGCSPASVTLTASGGTSGQYRWYSVATGGTAIVGETSGSYTTASLTSTVTYYASIDNGTCESTRTAVIATINSCTTNQPPVIQTTSLATQIDGEVTLSLLSLISDPDNNIDLTKLTIVSQPKSGAVASIDASQNLIIDYKNIAFAGLDELTIEVCDLAGSCVQQKISIDVAGDIIVYNGISPNGDDQNPIFRIKYIDLIDATKNNRVSIYNRWGSKVFEVENYNNTTNVFTGLNENGNLLPSGTYFYKIEFSSGRKIESGYLSLKR